MFDIALIIPKMLITLWWLVVVTTESVVYDQAR